jgi:hypothetical protein
MRVKVSSIRLTQDKLPDLWNRARGGGGIGKPRWFGQSCISEYRDTGSLPLVDVAKRK